MSNYLKYAVLSTVKLTQLEETINQLRTIKYPTSQIKELIKKLDWIKKDFEPTIKILNEQSKCLFEYNTKNIKNIQLTIEFTQ